MKEKLSGFVRVIEIKENKDGSANFELEYNKAFEKNLKEALKIKRLTKKRVVKIIKEALFNYCERHKDD